MKNTFACQVVKTLDQQAKTSESLLKVRAVVGMANQQKLSSTIEFFHIWEKRELFWNEITSM